MNWAAWIMAMIAPIASRAMIALGFTAVTFTGVAVAANELISYAQSAWSGMPLAVLQLCSLSGIPEYFGMVFGALVARLAMWGAVGASRYVFSPSH
jgi:hypothetical protein